MNTKSVTVQELFDEKGKNLTLELLNGISGLQRSIKKQDLCIPGLALAGFMQEFPEERVMVMGIPEVFYLETKTSSDRKALLQKLLEFEIPCIIIANAKQPPEELIEVASQKNICVFRSGLSVSLIFNILTEYLDEIFAPEVTVYGTLVDCYGMGLLFTGRSGIGKSEIALDLIERGHRLVADDVVILKHRRGHVLIGSGADVTRHHIEIRGLGIIDAMKIFGIRGVRRTKRVEVEVHLEDKQDISLFDRTGLEHRTVEYLGIKIPIIKLPIFPGKNISVIVEAVALNTIMKMYGQDSAQQLNVRLIEEMRQKSLHRESVK